MGARASLLLIACILSFLCCNEDSGAMHEASTILTGGEVLTLDLRRAPGTVRFELKRKHDVLGRGERDDVHSAA